MFTTASDAHLHAGFASALGEVRDLAASPTRSAVLVIGTSQPALELFTGLGRTRLFALPDKPVALALASDGLVGAAVLTDGSVRSVDLLDGTARSSTPQPATTAAFFDDGRAVVLAGPTGLTELGGLAARARAPSPRLGAKLLQPDAGRPALLVGGTATDTFWLHPDTLRWEPIAAPGGGPLPRVGAAYAHDPQRRQLYVVGGSVVNGVPNGEVWRLDLVTWSWLRLDLGDGLFARKRASATWDRTRHKILLFGGDGPEGPSDKLLAFDPGAQRWLELTPACEHDCPAPARRPAFYVDPITRQLIVAGGDTGSARSGFYGASIDHLGVDAVWRSLGPASGGAP